MCVDMDTHIHTLCMYVCMYVHTMYIPTCINTAVYTVYAKNFVVFKFSCH